MNTKHKRIIAYIFCFLLSLGPTNKSSGDPGILLTGASIIASSAAISSILNNAIDNAAEEARSILQEALNGAQNLEAATSDDLRDLEKMTMEDLDRLTSNRMSDLDNLLQNTLAQLVQAGNQIDLALARQVRDAIRQSAQLWQIISKDLDEKMIKVERGVAKIIDLALIQVIRIVMIVVSVVLGIVGLLLLRKIKKPALIATIVAAVLLVFTLTPLFPMVLTNFGMVEREFNLNANLPPPTILSVYPSPPLKWKQQGLFELIGLNFVSRDGSAKLMWGSSLEALAVDEAATFEPSRASISMENTFTKNSGTYYFKIVRKDADATQESEIITVYVQKPKEIPIVINYKIWQNGQWKSFSNTPWQVRVTQNDHALTKVTRKCYDFERYVEGWNMYDFEKTWSSYNNHSDLFERIENDYFKVHFCLRSGPKTDRWRGWYEADYILKLSKLALGSTEELATRGEVVLFLDEETGRVTAQSRRTYTENFSLFAYENRLGGRIVAEPPSDKPRQPLNIYDNIMQSTIRPGDFWRPSKNKPNPSRPIVRPNFNLSLLEAWLGRARTVEKDIFIGTAPNVPGFTAEETKYDVVVVFPKFTKSELGKKGTTTILDETGVAVMTFDIVPETIGSTKVVKLWADWLYLPPQ